MTQISDEHRQERASEPPTTLTQTEARQGIAPHIVRYVLIWGLILVIIAFFLAYFFMA